MVLRRRSRVRRRSGWSRRLKVSSKLRFDLGAVPAADTVREVQQAVLAAVDGALTDDATTVCLSVE